MRVIVRGGGVSDVGEATSGTRSPRSRRLLLDLVTGEWVVERTSAKQRRVMHYWLTIIWFTVGTAMWLRERDSLWFVGFMSLYAIWITHLAGWAAETPVEREAD